MLGLVRPRIRGQKTEAFIRTADVLAWGCGRCQRSKYKKTVEDQKSLGDDLSCFPAGGVRAGVNGAR